MTKSLTILRAAVLGTMICGAAATDAAAQQTIGGCSILPADNIWNTPVDSLPVLSNSTAMVNTIGATRGFHPDFGAGQWDGGPIGIPFITVRGTQPKYPASFLWPQESDPGPYAVPMNAPIEGGSNGTGDRHVIALDTDNCILYEFYRGFPQGSSWTADSGAIYNLRSNALRPTTWTSADAAGLPILPGLVTYEEVMSGEIKHAIRFTAPQTRREFVWPARHYASTLTGTQYPRMGERFRLKANFDISGFPAQVQVILRAMKKYGIILADNGSAWYLSGKPDERWNNDVLRSLRTLVGSNFEAVDATVLRLDPNSGAARQSGVSVTVSPATASLQVGSERVFSATVTGAAGGVTWSVNDTPGGDALVGTIDSSGRYLAPTVVPSGGAVTIRATSTAAPTFSGTARVTIVAAPAAPVLTLSSVSPTSIQVGTRTLTVTGQGFTSGAVLSFGGVLQPTTVESATRLTALVTASSARASVPVLVTAPGGLTSNTLSVTVTAPPATTPVTISISPTSARMHVRQPKRFSASVTGTNNRTVVWKVNGITGGNQTVGTISTTGLYVAPSRVPSPATVTISATVLVGDSGKSASAQVAITRR